MGYQQSYTQRHKMRKSVLFKLFLLICLSFIPAAAQIKSHDKLVYEYLKLEETLNHKIESNDNRCESFGTPDFYGSPVTFELDNVDVRLALEQIAKQAGVNFVIDRSVGPSNLTVTVSNLPWTVALNNILKTQELTATVKCPVLYISKTANSNGREIETKNNFSERELPIPLHTEFIRLKVFPLRTIISDEKPELGSDVGMDLGEDTKKFLKIIAKLLSRRGLVEADIRSNTIIIIDEESRVKLISNFVKMLDDSDFSLKEIIDDPVFGIK